MKTQNSRNQKQFNIFMVGLSTKITELDLKEYFQVKYPSLYEIKMKKRDTHSNKIAGYAFLFLNEESEWKHILSQKHFYIKGRTLTAQPFFEGEALKKYKEEVNKKRLFVAGIPFNFSDSDLESVLNSIAPVDQAFVVRNVRKGNSSRGYGYVTFKTVEGAMHALKIRNIRVGNKIIYLLKVKPKHKERENPNPAPIFENRKNVQKHQLKAKNHQNHMPHSQFLKDPIYPRKLLQNLFCENLFNDRNHHSNGQNQMISNFTKNAFNFSSFKRGNNLNRKISEELLFSQKSKNAKSSSKISNTRSLLLKAELDHRNHNLKYNFGTVKRRIC